MLITRRYWQALGLAAAMALGACQPASSQDSWESSNDPAALTSRARAEGCAELGPGLLPESLLQLDDSRQIQETIGRCLTVSDDQARELATTYAELEMGCPAPVTVRSVLPVVDADGVLIAREVVVSSTPRPEGVAGLEADLAVLDLDNVPRGSRFQRAHEATALDHFTIRVSARFFRHPVRWAHRGVPRWLALRSDVDGLCPGGAAMPEAIVPCPSLEGGLREAVRYGCGQGQTVLFSHHGNASVDPTRIRARHRPEGVFRRWVSTVTSRYPDPAERLAFTESLWRRYLSTQELP